MESEQIKNGTTAPGSESTETDKILGELNEEFETAVSDYLVTLAVAAEDGPLLGTFFPPPSELWTALDLPFWVAGIFEVKSLEGEDAPQILDYCEQLGVTPLMCSLVKAGIFLLYTGGFFTPTMLIGATEPCDANVELWQMANEYEPWIKVPKFTIDIPYEIDKMDNDDPAVSYLAEQIKASVSFVEQHSGLKMDINRLKEVCEESNRACQLRLEFQEMRRTAPTPVSCVWDNTSMVLSSLFGCGKPETTKWLQKLVDAAGKRVREGKGSTGVTEKVRLLWYDFAPTWGPKVFPRLEKDFGAVVIVEMGGWYPPVEPIDTSTEESIYKSLARIYATAPPMIRQGMVSLEQYCNDIVRIVNDFKIDAVILPSHVGHRNTNSLVKISTEVCREIGVPNLFLACDIWDERKMTPDEVYEKISRFLYAMDLV